MTFKIFIILIITGLTIGITAWAISYIYPKYEIDERIYCNEHWGDSIKVGIDGSAKKLNKYCKDDCCYEKLKIRT